MYNISLPLYFFPHHCLSVLDIVSFLLCISSPDQYSSVFFCISFITCYLCFYGFFTCPPTSVFPLLYIVFLLPKSCFIEFLFPFVSFSLLVLVNRWKEQHHYYDVNYLDAPKTTSWAMLWSLSSVSLCGGRPTIPGAHLAHVFISQTGWHWSIRWIFTSSVSHAVILLPLDKSLLFPGVYISVRKLYLFPPPSPLLTIIFFPPVATCQFSTPIMAFLP